MSWLCKLMGGWLPIGTKPFPEWAGKIIWAVGICVAVNLIISHFFPGKPVVQNIGTYQAEEKRDTIGIGCNVFRLYVKGGLKSK